MDELEVPEDIMLPDDSDDELRRQIEDANEYLQWAREHMEAMGREVKRLGNVRGNAVLKNGPNGILLR